jgi:hypothetical protein
MGYAVSFIGSVVVWGVVLVCGLARHAAYHRGRSGRRPARLVSIVTLGTFLSATLLFVPIYGETFGEGLPSGAQTVFVSLHNVLRMFVLDAEFTMISEYVQGLPFPYNPLYSLWAAFLYLLAPVLTFGVVLSFFKGLTAYRRYLLQYRRDAHVFSTLDERSLVLAESIRAQYPKAAIVFTDAFDQEAGHADELLERALRIRAVCFKGGITNRALRTHSKDAALSFYLMDKNGAGGAGGVGPAGRVGLAAPAVAPAVDAGCTEQVLSLLREFKMRANTRLYLFSFYPETEFLINSALEGSPLIKVFRVDEAQSLVYRFLYEHSIFASAEPTLARAEPTLAGAEPTLAGTKPTLAGTGPAEKEKQISAVILGLGRYGSEMLKALCWCGQMVGYRLSIHVFDRSADAIEHFEAACPDLIAHNGDTAPGDAQYSIRFHRGMDYRAPGFEQALDEAAATFAFVSLGDDRNNLDAALCLRMLFERQGRCPDLFTVIDSSIEANLIRRHRLVNFKGQDYQVQVIGDFESRYSYDAVVASELEREALKRHLCWGSEADFYRFSYYYRSSMATAIHAKWCNACNVPEAQRPRLEHRRWNAYMRAEGYVYSGSTDSSSRNDIAKLHNDLVDFDLLSADEANKDVAMTQE